MCELVFELKSIPPPFSTLRSPAFMDILGSISEHSGTLATTDGIGADI
jgi:hypothetical protein